MLTFGRAWESLRRSPSCEPGPDAEPKPSPPHYPQVFLAVGTGPGPKKGALNAQQLQRSVQWPNFVTVAERRAGWATLALQCSSILSISPLAKMSSWDTGCGAPRRIAISARLGYPNDRNFSRSPVLLRPNKSWTTVSFPS